MTNPTPQLHADDVKLTEAIHSYIWPFVSYQDDTIRRLQVIITQVTTPLRLSNEALRERVQELEKQHSDAVMPGAWICDKCGFILQKNNLYVQSGNIGANMTDHCEGCPNDGTAMRGLTWREVNNDYHKMLIESRTKLTAASEVIEKCERAISFMVPQTRTAIDALDKALAAIKEWKDKIK